MPWEDRFSGTHPRSCIVTGAAGFIGFFLSRALLEAGWEVCGVDNLNSYYDVSLKTDRLEQLYSYKGYSFVRLDISARGEVIELFERMAPEIVFHLAAQAGVRYSLEHPEEYVSSNLEGFFSILEACRASGPKHLIYASSSSVYGENAHVPFRESDRTDEPVSLYAATKKSNELMAHVYSRLYGIKASGLRFFTVYGPFGRPDMAYFSFLDTFFRGEPIHIYNNGDTEHDLLRDFTYIDDIVTGMIRLTDTLPAGPVAHTIYNIGNQDPVRLTEFITTLEECVSCSLGRPVVFEKSYEPLKPGDVPVTAASTQRLHDAVGFAPSTPLKEGLQKFTDWYCSYYDKT